MQGQGQGQLERLGWRLLLVWPWPWQMAQAGRLPWVPLTRRKQGQERYCLGLLVRLWWLLQLSWLAVVTLKEGSCLSQEGAWWGEGVLGLVRRLWWMLGRQQRRV